MAPQLTQHNITDRLQARK